MFSVAIKHSSKPIRRHKNIINILITVSQYIVGLHGPLVIGDLAAIEGKQKIINK